MGEPRKQYQPIDLLEFKRRLQARTEPVATSLEDPLAELVRIVGGKGRVVSASGGPPESAPPPAMPLKTGLGPLQGSEQRLDNHLSRDVAADPPVDDAPHLDDSTSEALVGRPDATSYENENILAATDDYAHPRLHKRRRSRAAWYGVAAVAVMVGVFAVFFGRRGGSVVTGADHPAKTAALAKTSPAEASSPAVTAPKRASDAGAGTDVAGGARLSSTPVPTPVSGNGNSATAAQANAAPPAQNDSQFPQPRVVHTVPVYGNGDLGAPTIVPTRSAQNAPASGMSFARVVEAQTLQRPASAASAPSSGNGVSPTSGPSTIAPSSDVASVEPPKAPPPAAAPSAPAASVSGTGYAAILAFRPTQSEALGMLRKLASKYRADLAGHRLTYHHVKRAQKTAYEIRVAGISKAQAKALCDKLKSAGDDTCQVGLR